MSQLIGYPEVVTVLIGDMDKIALSAEIKYAALESLSLGAPGTPGPGAAPRITSRGPVGSYGREYLEKLIQIQLRLPPPLSRDLRKMLVPITGERPAFPQNLGIRKRGFPGMMAKVTVRHFPWVLGPALTVLATIIIAIIGSNITAAKGHSGGSTLSGRAVYWWVIVWAIAGMTLGVMAPVVFERYRERRKKRTRTALDKEVRDVVKPTETALKPEDVQELVQRLDKQIQADQARMSALAVPATVRRRMRQRIISNNELRTELDRAVLEVLPLSPRAAKRMFNHAHLLLDIGVERGIFDTQPRLQPRQLAAWVALNERWPSVAAAITNDPTLLGRLEQAARQTAQQSLNLEQLAALESNMGITGLDLSLLDYLRRSDSLVSCVHLLVNFPPDMEQGSAPDASAPFTSADGTAEPRNSQASAEAKHSSAN